MKNPDAFHVVAFSSEDVLAALRLIKERRSTEFMIGRTGLGSVGWDEIQRRSLSMSRTELMAAHLENLMKVVHDAVEDRDPRFGRGRGRDPWPMVRGWVSDLVGWDATIQMADPDAAYDHVRQYILDLCAEVEEGGAAESDA